jgi:ADP-heptose:LPS heptosyltransferase
MNFSGKSSILIINLGGIGDLLLSSGALKLIRDAHPGRLDLLAFPQGAEFMRRYGLFDSIHSLPRSSSQALRLAWSLRKNRYDLAVNMRSIVRWSGAAKIFALVKLTGARVSAGRNTDGKGFFFGLKVPETYLAEQPEHRYDLDMARLLGATGASEPYLPRTDDDDRWAGEFLINRGWKPGTVLFGMHPGGQPSRRWPADRFVEAGKKLLKDRGGMILLTGSPSEKELCHAIAIALGNDAVIDASGETSPFQLAALIKKCNSYISNDTGAMHLCTAVGTPGVYLFGGGNPVRFAPFRNPERYRVLQKKLSCSPCEITTCPSIRCMKEIRSEEVHGAVVALLNENHV